MARLASQAKGGFYATPPEEMALVCRRLHVEAGAVVNLLDPCCGEGTALRQMADCLAGQGALPKTYGIEPEETRYDAAKKILDRVLKTGYEWVRASHGVFSAMWLNPPYDNSMTGERTEVVFLRSLTAPDKYLQPGGLLMFCVPQSTLGPAANLLAVRFQDIRVYRFTEENYPRFRQVVLFGYRRQKRPSSEEVKKVKEYLEAVAKAGPWALPPLDTVDNVFYAVPPAAGAVEVFRGSTFDPKEVAIDVDNSPVWEQVENLLLPPHVKNTCVMKNPVLPLKPTHMGIAIAAGVVGGNMGNHLLVGMTKKVREIVDSDENHEIEMERYITTVRVFTQDGIYDLS